MTVKSIILETYWQNMNTINLVRWGGHQPHVTHFPLPTPSQYAVHNPVNYIFVFHKQETAN